MEEPKRDEPFLIQEAEQKILGGNEAWKKGDVETAYRCWSEAATIDPGRKAALDRHIAVAREKLVEEMVRRADESEAMGDMEEAQKILRRALALGPSDPEMAEQIKTRIHGRETTESAGRWTVMILVLIGTAILLFLFGMFVLKWID